jgi:hypothetical protein
VDNSEGKTGWAERRSLPRLRPRQKVWIAADNETRGQTLGMAEVTEFSGLGLTLRGMPGDPVAAAGDRLWVTLIAEEGVIPLRATLTWIDRRGVCGLCVEVPAPAGQHFLIGLYERAAASRSMHASD